MGSMSQLDDVMSADIDGLSRRVRGAVAVTGVVLAGLAYAGGVALSPQSSGSTGTDPGTSSSADGAPGATTPTAGSTAAPSSTPSSAGATAPALVGKTWTQVQELVPEGVELTVRAIATRQTGQAKVLSQSPAAGSPLGDRLSVVLLGEGVVENMRPTGEALPQPMTATCGGKQIEEALTVSGSTLAAGLTFTVPELAVRLEMQVCALPESGEPTPPRVDLALSNADGRTLQRRRVPAVPQPIRLTVTGGTELTLRAVGPTPASSVVVGPIAVTVIR